jgi:hypothetical protein
MPEEYRPTSTLEYESRLSPPRPPAPPPVAISVAAMACGTAMVLAPWLAVGLSSSSIATIRYVTESPLTWLTALAGLALTALGYFRARR